MATIAEKLKGLGGAVISAVTDTAVDSYKDYTGPGQTSSSLNTSPAEIAVKKLTDALGGDPFKFSTLAYPRDVTQDMANGHYMLFYVNVQNKTKFRYTDPEGERVGDVYETYVDLDSYEGAALGKGKLTEMKGANAAEVEYAKRSVGKGQRGNVNTSDGVDLFRGRKVTGGIASKVSSTTRITDSVAIYLPAVAEDKTSAEYNGGATGLAGLAAAGGVDFINAMGRNDFEGAAAELVGGVGTALDAMVQKTGSEIADFVLGNDSEAGTLDIFNKAFGRAENPYMEVVFKQMKMRTFTYAFTFAPRNELERDDVQAIIKLFRFHMAPELKGGNNRYLTLPSTFDIHYMYQQDLNNANENNFYSKISTCVLNDVTVDYSPEGVKSFQDGSPTQISMTLGFEETELLTKDKINDGF